MSFELATLNNPSSFAAYAGATFDTNFGDAIQTNYNKITHEGGRLSATLNKAPYITDAERLSIVIVGYSGDTFRTVKRAFWLKGFGDQQSAKPDCSSDDGVTPRANSVAPQSNSCASCDNFKKPEGAKYGKCGFKKDFLVFILERDAQGGVFINYDAPFSFAAPATSLFNKIDPNTASGGFLSLVPAAIAKVKGTGAPAEALVYDLCFAQGSKAPVIQATGGVLPVDIYYKVMEAAKEPSAQRMIGKDGTGASVLAIAAPAAAPAPAIQYQSPPAQMHHVAEPPAPVQYAPPAPAPVQYAPPAPAPVQYAPPAPAPVQYAPPAPAPVQYQSPPAQMYHVTPTPEGQYTPDTPAPVQYAQHAPAPTAAGGNAARVLAKAKAATAAFNAN